MILLGRATLFLLVYVTLALTVTRFLQWRVNPNISPIPYPEDWQYPGPSVLDRMAKFAGELPDIALYALTALLAVLVVYVVEKYVRRLTSG